MTDQKYVSRGGLKLEHALKIFRVDVSGLTVLDVGSSTGGFVDCLLQNGADKVYAVDTAYGELAWKLRQDPRVVVLERENILFLNHLPDRQGLTLSSEPLVNLITIDVSFTSLTKVLPVVKKFLDPSTSVGIITLLKPQYEDQKLSLKHHGVIPENFHQDIIKKVIASAISNGYQYINLTPSPILGREGNKEYFLFLLL